MTQPKFLLCSVLIARQLLDPKCCSQDQSTDAHRLTSNVENAATSSSSSSLKSHLQAYTGCKSCVAFPSCPYAIRASHIQGR